MKNIYTNPNDFPHFTSLGFMKTKVPIKIWNLISDVYKILRMFPPKEESFKDLDPKYKDNSYSELFELKHVDYISKHIHEELKYIHEWWCKQPLECSAMWGYVHIKKDLV